MSVSIGAKKDAFLRDYAPSDPARKMKMDASLDDLIEAVVQFTLDSLKEILEHQTKRGEG